jgi:hypothetical protein
MDNLLKWAVMVQLRRGNPAYPPRAKVGTAQRRLDTAFAIAKAALSYNPYNWRDWAARQILDARRSGDPLPVDLADRLARAIWYEKIDELVAEAWFYFYTTPNTSAECGFSPKGWVDILPIDATTEPFQVSLTPFRRELLQLAAELDGSFGLSGDEISPKPCLTGRAVKLINRLADLKLPLPHYHGKEYEGGSGLLDLAFLRLCLLRGKGEHAVRVAQFIGKKWIARSMTSGSIYGPGVQGQARPWDTRKKILWLKIDPRITAGVDPNLVDAITGALYDAIA